MPSRYLTRLAAGPIFFKVEAFQRTGSFKLRGAASRSGLLTAEERSRRVVAASAGNHAQGVAFVARAMGAIRVLPVHCYAINSGECSQV